MRGGLDPDVGSCIFAQGPGAAWRPSRLWVGGPRPEPAPRGLPGAVRTGISEPNRRRHSAPQRARPRRPPRAPADGRGLAARWALEFRKRVGLKRSPRDPAEQHPDAVFGPCGGCWTGFASPGDDVGPSHRYAHCYFKQGQAKIERRSRGRALDQRRKAVPLLVCGLGLPHSRRSARPSRSGCSAL